MASSRELIKNRRATLISLGYKPTIVDLAMEWAHGCAEGMATYVTKQGVVDNDTSLEELTSKFLPPYLLDCENWMRSFGHEPGEVKHIS